MKDVIVEVERDEVLSPGVYTVRARIFNNNCTLGHNRIFSDTIIKYHGDRNQMIRGALAKTADSFIKWLEAEEEHEKIMRGKNK